MAIRLLAITPPTGPVDPAVVDAWIAGGAGPHLALLVREPGRPRIESWDGDVDGLLGGRLAPVIKAAEAAGIPRLLSCPIAGLGEAAKTVTEGRFAGVQLRGDPDEAVLRRARALLPAPAVLGRSCHGWPPDAAGHAWVDYTCVAPVLAPGTPQPGTVKRALGTDGLAAWTRGAGAYVLALGAVTPETAGACARHGAHGFAGISVFFGDTGRVVEDVVALCAALETAPGPHDRHAPIQT